MDRSVTFRAAFDKRDPNPGKDYGIHGVECLFVLKGPKGATQFLLFTNWHLPNVQDEMDERDGHICCHPMPADLGYHSPEPTWEGQSVGDDACPFLDGRRCYYDESGLNAEPVYERLLREGDAGVWAALEDYYRELFESSAVSS